MQLIAITFSLLFLMLIIELLRRKHLREQYSILWLFGALVLLILSIWRRCLDILAAFLGIAYPPSALFVTLLILLFLILIHFSAVISKLTERTIILAQELALLSARLEKMEKICSERKTRNQE